MRFLLMQNDSKTNCYVFDYEKKTIISVDKGNRTDETKVCKKMYDTCEKKNNWYNARTGATYYRNLLDNKKISGFDMNQLIETDSVKEISEMIYKIQIEQIKHIEWCGIGYSYI